MLTEHSGARQVYKALWISVSSTAWEKNIHLYFVEKISNTINFWGFPSGTTGKEPTCKCRRQETQVQSLGWEDPLEEGKTTHSSILTWRTPMDREVWAAMVNSVHRVRLKQLNAHIAWCRDVMSSCVSTRTCLSFTNSFVSLISSKLRNRPYAWLSHLTLTYLGKLYTVSLREMHTVLKKATDE